MFWEISLLCNVTFHVLFLWNILKCFLSLKYSIPCAGLYLAFKGFWCLSTNIAFHTFLPFLSSGLNIVLSYIFSWCHSFLPFYVLSFQYGFLLDSFQCICFKKLWLINKWNLIAFIKLFPLSESLSSIYKMF